MLYFPFFKADVCVSKMKSYQFLAVVFKFGSSISLKGEYVYFLLLITVSIDYNIRIKKYVIVIVCNECPHTPFYYLQIVVLNIVLNILSTD